MIVAEDSNTLLLHIMIL